MVQIEALQAEQTELKLRFRNIRDELKKLKDRADMRESFHFKAMNWQLTRVRNQLDLTDDEDIKENERLQEQLESKFAKKAKNKPKEQSE